MLLLLHVGVPACGCCYMWLLLCVAAYAGHPRFLLLLLSAVAAAPKLLLLLYDAGAALLMLLPNCVPAVCSCHRFQVLRVVATAVLCRGYYFVVMLLHVPAVTDA